VWLHAGGIMTLLNNFGCLCYLIVASYVPSGILNVSFLLVIVVCFVLMGLVQERYNRAMIEGDTPSQ
jgi:hypothetical protein